MPTTPEEGFTMTADPQELHAEIARLDEEEGAREEVLERVAELLRDDPGLVNRPAPPEYPYPPLFTAVMVLDEDLVDLLLSHGADWRARATISLESDCFLFDDRCAGRDTTLLHTAAAVGHAELVELFLRKGIDVNAPDGDGYTPLFVGARTGYNGEAPRETLQVLLDHGADTRVTVGGESLMDAAAEGNLQLAELLEERGMPLTLAAALRLGRVEQIRAILRDHPEQIPQDPVARGQRCCQVILFLGDRTFTPRHTRDPERTRQEAARNRQVLRDHLDILEAFLRRAAGEPFPACSALSQAVQLVGPEAADLLLRHGIRPVSALETNLLLSAAGMNMHCAAEMRELLARYGIEPRPDAPPLHRPPVLFANVPPPADAPEGQDKPRIVAIPMDWSGPPGDAPATEDAIGDYLGDIMGAFGKALGQAHPDVPPDEDDPSEPESPPERE
jgi:Ankyrin repeats (3 copies)